MVCRDAAEHRRRVETRSADVHAMRLPDWRAVQTRLYEPWSEADLIVDTAAADAQTAAARIIEALRATER